MGHYVVVQSLWTRMPRGSFTKSLVEGIISRKCISETPQVESEWVHGCECVHTRRDREKRQFGYGELNPELPRSWTEVLERVERR